NYMGGPEQPDTNGNWRNVGNVVGQWKASDRTVFTLELSYGGEPDAVTAGETATWGAIVGYARLGLSDSFALNLRGEYFADPDGARTGVPQYLKEVTLTPEWKISSHFLVRGDLRVDWSNRDVFEKKNGFTSTQPTLLLDVVYVF
ncbi:MAG TPA: outer membrane beta-barrel protein, partial [Thermoanaerobaculia bacterium]|nr:outer membrane beta-barrel protein [Thermoanaerobaculia bacterium]